MEVKGVSEWVVPAMCRVAQSASSEIGTWWPWARAEGRRARRVTCVKRVVVRIVESFGRSGERRE